MRKFRVVLPPGWVQFDLSAPVEEQAKVAVSAMFQELPRDARRALRQQMAPTISSALANLAEGGAVAAYMSVENPGTAALFPVVAIRPAEFTIGDTPLDPMDYLVALVGTGEVELIDPIGMVGVKRVTDRDVSSALESEARALPQDVLDAVGGATREEISGVRQIARQVEYTLGVPETDDCWMVVAAEVTADGDEAAARDALDAVTQFLDAWVETITWEVTDDE